MEASVRSLPSPRTPIPQPFNFKLPNPAAKLGHLVQQMQQQSHLRRDRPQQATLTGRGEFKHLLREGNACEAKFDSAGALGCYERALQLDGGSCEALLRCSKALSDLTLEPGTPSGDAQAMVRRAVVLAEAARLADDGDARTHLALAINLARLAVYSDNKTKVSLVRQVREGAERAIATDAEEDLAYHMLGRWHNEIASINWAIKLAIDLFYGGLGESGSHQHAKRLFDKAIEINPTRMVHHVEMGRTYIKMGEHQKARQCLEYAMQLEVEDVNALHEKFDGEEMLKMLNRGDNKIETGWRTVPTAWHVKNRALERAKKFPGC